MKIAATKIINNCGIPIDAQPCNGVMITPQ
jgi:hypothetical protein